MAAVSVQCVSARGERATNLLPVTRRCSLTQRGTSERRFETDVWVWWATVQPSGEVDPYSQHGSCPVKRGEKWTATVWTRGRNRFDPSDQWKTSDLLKLCQA